MKINKKYYDTYEYRGEKYYRFEKINENVGAYVGALGETWFELDTLEQIGWIDVSDTMYSRKTFYNATCMYGWNGLRKTKKEWYKTLCTRADYLTAKNLLMNEYEARKQ